MSKEKKQAVNEEKKSQATTPPTKKGRRVKILRNTAIVIVALLIVFILARDLIIRAAVVNIGSKVTGTKVEMGSFSSSFGGKVELTDFRVANPAGYQEPYAFQVGKVKVDVNIGSLFTDKIEVSEVFVSGTKVNFEVKLDGSSNLTDIQNNVEAFAGTDADDQIAASTPEAEPEPKPKSESKAKKTVVIRLVTVEGTELSVSSALLNTSVPLPLPTITLTDLGEGESFGEMLSDFTGKMLGAISSAISKSGIKGVGDSLKEAGKNLGDALVQGGETLQDAGKSLGESLKGLLKTGK
ncbi:MAG: AsmA family protein [Victivallales bacterium]|nr:AsmA family protein [Victivallales bacterium]